METDALSRQTRLPFFAFSLTAIALVLAGCASGVAQESFFDAAKYHHTPDGFRNPPGSPEREFRPVRFMRFVSKRMSYQFDPATIPPNHVMPAAEAKAQLAAITNQRLTWIGHATFLITIDGVNVLTDPFFSERASPFTNIGPGRYVPLVIGMDDLPPIDVIIISHNHYDSFDLPSLKVLAKRKPDTLVLVPLGLGKLAREAGFTNVRDVDWYDEHKSGGVTFTSTPAIHWSKRSLADNNQTLWNGFMITGASKKIWFAGDTGFGPVFEKEVAPKVGPADIALVPIGAFLPRDFMKPMHTSPTEALKLARIMGAKTAIAKHWGTVQLGEDTPVQGVGQFLSANEPGVTKRVMRIGETVGLDKL